MALTGASALRARTGQQFFNRIARARTNPPREYPHIFLTALARFARWAGVYECGRVALVRSGTLTILASMAFDASLSRTRRPLLTN